MNLNYIPLLGSEIALSLYPQLIKLVPSTIELQVAIRCITYTLLAIIGYFITTYTNPYYNNKTTPSTLNNINTNNTNNTFSFIITSIIMGIVNIIHIISSYICFNTLSSGVGYSIFYIYPIFNLLGRTLIYNEKIDSINYIYILISILGVYLIYKHNNKETTLEPKLETIENVEQKNSFQTISDIINTKNTTMGIGAGLISAFTESIIYFIVKDNLGSISPFIQLFKTYLVGGIVSILYLIQTIPTTLDYHYWITLILFNALIGFVGYLLRFIMIPKLSTLLFNSLIFIGVIFSYIWGYLLSNEPLTYNTLSGTLLILLSIGLINKS
jgi:drug/metabolite transporter (DMT)-like permease